MRKFYVLLLIMLSFAVSGWGQTITQVGSATSANGTNVNSLTINKPTGVVEGDIMIANLAYASTSTMQNAASSGWTVIKGAGTFYLYGTTLYKVATSSEPSSYSFNSFRSGSNTVDYVVGSIIAFSGVDGTGGLKVDGSSGGPFDVTPNNIALANPASNTTTASAITTVTPNAAIIFLGQNYRQGNAARTWNDYSWTTTAPGNLTEIMDFRGPSNQRVGVGAAWAIKSITGTTGSGTVTLSGAAYNGGLLIALRPKPVNTIITGTISPLSYCAGSSVSVPFTSSGTFNSGNTYTAQLSNASGSFGSPTNIGTLNSTANSGTITATIPGATPYGTGYRIRVISSNPSVTGSDNGANITITSPSANAGSPNPPICQGGTTTGLGGTVGGSAAGGTWSDGGIGGTFSPNANTLNATWTPPAGYSGTATLTLTTTGGSCGTATSSKSQVVNPTLVAGSINANQTICYNTSPATLNSVSLPSGGTGSYTYQWQSSADNSTWTNIGSTNSATYSPGNLSTTTYFRRTATSGTCGTVYSNSVKITVLPQITSGQIGSAQSICYNTTPAAITNTTSPAGGTGSFTYQWQSSPNGTSGWTTIGGATSDSYQPGALTTTTYYRRVETSGTCAPVYSNVIQITVYGNLTAGSVGASQTICYNAAPSTFTNITSPAGGTGTYTYQWQSSPDNSTWSDITGANSATYTAGNLTTTTYFRRNVTSSGGCGTVSSAPITVTVNPDLVAGSIGADQTICYNTSPATLNSVSLPSGGTGSYTYQWQSSPDNSTWTNIVGATSSTYAPGTLTQTTYFRRTETSGTCGTVNSNVVTITVNPLPTATISGTSTVCLNSSPQPQITFTGANGTAPYTFTYTINGGSPQTVTTVSGNSVTVNVPTTVAGTFTYALVSVKDASSTTCTNSSTGTAVISVKTPPSITTNPTSVNTCATLPVNFYVTATGDDLTYQWYKVGTPDVAVTNSANISGAQSANLHFNQASVADDGDYYVVVSGSSACAVATSTTATLTVNEQMVFSQQPVSAAVCAGSTTTLSVTVTGGLGVTYQWRRGTLNISNGLQGSGAVISGANSPTLTISNATLAESGNDYNVIAYSLAGCNSALSANASIVVNPNPAVNSIANKILCNGASTGAINFTGSVAGTVYNWTNDNTAIGLAASGTGNIPAFNVTNSTNAPITATITVTPSYTNAGSPSETCTGTPITFTITVNPTATVNTVADQIVCNGSSTSEVTFGSLATGGTVTYNWTNNTPSIGLAASGNGNISSFTATNITNAPVTATITVTPSFDGCPGTPSTFTITVNPTATVNTVANQTVCNGSSTSAVTFVSPATGGTVTYNWTNNTPSIGLAASGNGNISSFTATNITNAPVTATITVTPSFDGCPGTPSTFTITVNPTATVNTVANQTVCNGSSTSAVTFVSPATGGTVTYNWTNNTPSIGLAASGNGNISSFTATNITNAPVTATITVTPSFDGCPGTPSTFTITVNPTVTIAPLTQEVCNNTPISTINISGLPAGAITSWTRTSPPGIASSDIPTSGSGAISGTFVNSTTASINVTFTLNTTADNGCVTSSTAVVTVDAPLVAPVIGDDQTICGLGQTPGDLIIKSEPFGGKGPYLYQWEINDPNNPGWQTIIGANGQTYQPSVDMKYRLKVTSALGCDVVYSNEVSIASSFAISLDLNSSITPNGPYCTNQTFKIHADAFSLLREVKYGWSYNPSYIDSDPSNGTNPSSTSDFGWFVWGKDLNFTTKNNGNSPITTTVRVTPYIINWWNNKIGCNLSPIDFNVIINPVATVNTISNQTVCAGSTVTVPNFSSPTTGGTITYSWSNNNSSIGLASSGTGNISSFTATNTSTTPITATITVTPSFTNGGKTCTGTSKTFTITVNPSPVVTITPAAQTICTGSATNIGLTSNVSGSAINWSVISQTGVTGASAGSGTSISQTLITTGSTPGTVVYSVNASANGCTGTAKTVTVTVNPSAAITSVTGGTSPLCIGATTTVNANGVVLGGGGTGVWSSSNNSVANVDNLGNVTAVGAGTANIIYTISGGCNGTVYAQQSITVSPNAAITSVTGTLDPICIGSTTTFTANGVVLGNGTGAWTSDNISVATVDGSGNVTAVGPGTANITFTISGGCNGTPSASHSITVNPDANAGTLTALGSTTLCIGSTVTLTSNGDAAGNWSSDNTSVATVNSSTGVVTAVGAGSANIIYTVTSGCNNPKSASLPITVNPNATAGVLSGYNGTPVCATSNVNLYSSVTGGVWTSGNTSIATVDPSSGVVSPTGPGTVTITYTINSGCNVPATATIDVTFVNAGPTLTPGAITGPSGNICPNEDVFTFSVSPVTDASYYLWQLPAGWTITSADPLSNNITVKTGYTSGTVKVSAGNACTYNSNTSDLIVKLHNVWAGVVDTDWNKAGNWSDNQVSSSSCPDIVIPSSAANQPVIPSGTVQINNLVMIGNSASLTLNTSANLKVSGSLTIPIGSYIDVTDATIEFNGSSAQNIASSNFKDTTIKYLIISNSAGVTVSSAGNSLAITGKLSFGASNARLNSGDNITLKSTKAHTANLGEVGASNNVSGEFTVERYINIGQGGDEHGKAWHVIAPNTSGQTIKKSWMENGDNSVVNYGINLTGAASGGWDDVSPAPAIKYYVPSSGQGSWAGAPNSWTPLDSKSAWMVFIRGDRSVTGQWEDPKPTTLRSKGTIKTGTQTIPVPAIVNGFYLIGNPYPSAVDVSKITTSDGAGILNFTLWNPNLGGIYGLGAYQEFTYNVNTNQYESVPGLIVNNTIQSGQGFFVKTSGTAYNVIFNEDAKVDASDNTMFFRGNGEGSRQVGTLRSNVLSGDGTILDGTLQFFSDDYSNEVDMADGRKMMNTGINLSVKVSNDLLVVERRAPLTMEDTIYYNLTGAANGKYTFSLEAAGLSASGLEGWFEDAFTGQRHAVNMEGVTNISFDITGAAASKAANRFRLVFKAALGPVPVTFVKINAVKDGNTVKVTWDVANEINLQKYVVMKSADGNTFHDLAEVKAAGRKQYTLTDDKPINGFNYYRIRSVDKDGSQSFSTIAKVWMGGGEMKIGVFPNPIRDGVVKLRFENAMPGKYVIRLYNPAGQTIVSKEISIAGGAHSESIPWDYKMAHGTYQLEVTKPDGSRKMIIVMY